MDELERPDPDSFFASSRTRSAARGGASSRSSSATSPASARPTPCSRRRRRQTAAGVDVVVGYVETHGAPETDALLEGLEMLPALEVEYRGITLREFDLDAALARHPSIILVDELAHTNAPGLRHPKRWQDVEELLDAGISVYTTLNVQHLESLNDTDPR